MNMELNALTALEQAKLVKEKKVSAVELLEAVYAQVEAVDGRPGSLEPYVETTEDREKVHAFITLAKDTAFKKAQDVDKRIAAGEKVGALAGVPYSAKDVYCTKDILTSAGSRILEGYKPPFESAVTEKMDKADAVMFGKVNCDEFTFGSTDETTAYLPYPRNPWNFERVPGGSSGGSAAAVAACEGAISLGSDTGGSIREPAAFCGLVGIKPSYGRVSRWGVIPFASSMDTLGPLTRSVADAALVMREIAGFDVRDNVTGNVPVDDYLAELEKGVKGMRVGLSPDYLKITVANEDGDYETIEIDPEIKAQTLRVADVLKDLGAEIVEDIPMGNSRYSVPAYFVISRIEAYSNLQRYDGLRYGHSTNKPVKDMYDFYFKNRGEGFGRNVSLRLLTGMFASKAEFYEKYYRRAQKARALMRRDYDEAFDPSGKYRLDVLLTPSTSIPAYRFAGAPENDSVLVHFADLFTTPMNFAGTPGVSFPVGLSSDGLPIGVQAAGYDYAESKILRAAYAFEQATLDESWRSVKPAILK